MDVLSFCDICYDCFFPSSVSDNPPCACWALICWCAYMCVCATIECEAATCVQDCHGEGQSSGLELPREQEGCNTWWLPSPSLFTLAAVCLSGWYRLRSPPQLCQPLRGGPSRMMWVLSQAVFSTSLKSLQSSPAERQKRLTKTDRQAHEFFCIIHYPQLEHTDATPQK